MSEVEVRLFGSPVREHLVFAAFHAETNRVRYYTVWLVKCERDLMDRLPRTEWIDFSHRMIHHGRRICSARRPKCDECGMKKFCPRIGVNG